MNKIHKFGVILAVAAVAGWGTQARAMTENWAAAVDTFLTLQGGTTGVPSGGYVALGSNTLSIAGMQALQDNPAALFAAFAPWVSSTIGSGTGIDGSYDIASTAPGTGFFGIQIYLIAFNNATPGSATQVGLYTNPAWTFPASDIATPNSIELTDPGLSIVIGSFSAGTVTTPIDLDGGDAVQLHQVIPEPSTWALVGMGLLGAIGLIRRRR